MLANASASTWLEHDAAHKMPSFATTAAHGNEPRFQTDPNFCDHVLFYEYFNGDTGEGLGARTQTGWTALVAKLLEQSRLWRS